MARDTSTDQITNDLIQRYVAILSLLDGWGVVTDASGTPTGKAVYPMLGLPQPQEPFPAAYVYVGGQVYDWSQLHQGIRRDTDTITIRIIGGAATAYTVVAQGSLQGDYPEVAVYKMITAVTNELTYRPFLNDPVTGAAFRYLDPDMKALVGQVGRIQGFTYGDQGSFIGIEIPATVKLLLKLGRLS